MPAGGAVDGGEERAQALLGLGCDRGAIDRSERFLEGPCLGENGVALEQFAEAAAFALGEALGGLQ